MLLLMIKYDQMTAIALYNPDNSKLSAKELVR